MEYAKRNSWYEGKRWKKNFSSDKFAEKLDRLLQFYREKIAHASNKGKRERENKEKSWYKGKKWNTNLLVISSQ